MKKIALLFTAMLFALCQQLLAQGTLTGKVNDKDGALPAATVNLPELKIATTTDVNGNFSLRLPNGQHRLMVSFVGFKTLDTTINIAKNEQTNIGFIRLLAQNELKGVTVTSVYGSGEIRAQAMRRNATSIMEVVSADAIGKLPDINAAEAVQRVPGVSIDRDQGEGRYVTVRGTPSQWSSTTINGSRMPAAKTSGDLLGNRTVPMDLLPSEFIQYIQVVKAITPEYEGDAIGGTINYITRTSADKRTLRVTGALPYNTRAEDKLGYNGTITYGDRLLKDKFGFLVLGNINKRTYATDDYEVIYGNQLHNVTTLDVRNYQGTRTNKGFNAAMDYKLGNNTKIYAQGYYTELLDNERNRKTMHYFNKATDNAVLRWNVVDYYFKNYGGEAGIQSQLSSKLNMVTKFALYNSWAGYKGPSSVDNNMRGYYYGNWVQTVKYSNLATVNGVAYKFLKGDGPQGYQGDEANNVQPHFDASTPYNPDNYFLDRYVTSIRNITEKDQVAATDFKYKVNEDLLIKFGAKLRRKTSSYDYRYVTWVHSRTAPKSFLNVWEREDFPTNNWFPELNNNYDNLKFSYPTENSFINPNGIPSVAKNLTYTVQDATNSSYATGNYDAVEKVGAGYLMGEWNITKQLTFVPGLRYEYTDVTMNSYQYNDITKKVTPVTGTKSFPSVLPMAHLIFKPNEQLDLRAAMTRTFARNAFNEMSPTTRVNPNTQAITTGNPLLKPTFSWNYDVMGSYYISNSSYLSGGLFYKDITDLVYTQSKDEIRNIDGVTAQYKVAQPLNAAAAKLYGIELAYNQKFTFLPGALSGLGINMNYTYTKSETNLDDRPGEKIGLMNQSPNIFNATLLYEKYGFSFRLSANYRQAFLVEIRDNKEADRFQDKDFHLDMNMSYTFPHRLTLFFDANNLNNEPLSYYHGVKSRPEQVEYYSARGRLGLTWSLGK